MISDFGCAKILEDTPMDPPHQMLEMDGTEIPKRRSSFVGSPPYVPPEILNGGKVTTAIDYWTLGVILFELLCSKRPFSDVSEYLTYKRILSLRYSFPEEFEHPVCSKDLAGKLLVLTPSLRLGSMESGGSESVKRHQFFADINWPVLCSTPSPLL